MWCFFVSFFWFFFLFIFLVCGLFHCRGSCCCCCCCCSKFNYQIETKAFAKRAITYNIYKIPWKRCNITNESGKYISKCTQRKACKETFQRLIIKHRTVRKGWVSPMLLRDTVDSLYFNISPSVKLLLKQHRIKCIAYFFFLSSIILRNRWGYRKSFSKRSYHTSGRQKKKEREARAHKPALPYQSVPDARTRKTCIVSRQKTQKKK